MLSRNRYFWDLSIDVVAVINLVLAVALSHPAIISVCV